MIVVGRRIYGRSSYFSRNRYGSQVSPMFFTFSVEQCLDWVPYSEVELPIEV